jgi:hypothetical protein
MYDRVEATQKVVDHFLDKPLEWGKHDCGRMAGMMLREMGHSPKLTRFGQYRTAAGALLAMKRQKFNDLPDVLVDLGLQEIALARALPGDIMAVPGEGMTALGVVVGNGRALFFAPDCVCRVGQLNKLDVARVWRVPCLK